jgi:hypothetical protein
MKNFDLSSMNVREMDALEMKETDGGIIVLLIVVAAVLLVSSSCVFNTQTQVPLQDKPVQETKPHAESTAVKNV